MSIKQEPKPCYLVTCDDCQEPLGSDEFASVHYESEAQAREGIKNYGWEITEDGKVRCEPCIDERKVAAS